MDVPKIWKAALGALSTKARIASFVAVAVLVGTIVRLNIETWAQSKGYDKLYEAGPIWEALMSAWSYLTGPFALGFALAALIFGLWDVVVRVTKQIGEVQRQNRESWLSIQRYIRDAALQRAVAPEDNAKAGIKWGRHPGVSYSGPATDVRISGLMLPGVNGSDGEVTLKDAWVTSQRTGEQIKLSVNVEGQREPLRLDQINPIPPGAPISLCFEFNQPLSPRDFLNDWGKFVLASDCGDGVQRSTFEGSPVSNLVKAWLPEAVGPRVTRKPGA